MIEFPQVENNPEQDVYDEAFLEALYGSINEFAVALDLDPVQDDIEILETMAECNDEMGFFDEMLIELNVPVQSIWTFIDDLNAIRARDAQQDLIDQNMIENAAPVVHLFQNHPGVDNNEMDQNHQNDEEDQNQKHFRGERRRRE